MITADEWMIAWRTFIDDIEKVVKLKLGFLSDENNRKVDGISGMLNEVMGILRGDDAINAVRSAISVQMPNSQSSDEYDPRQHKILDLLFREMNVFHATAERAGTTRNEADTDEAVEDAGTTKTSVEGLGKLPRWVNKILAVLNQILKLISGGGAG